MKNALLPLSFSVASRDTLDTLEAVLAIARRGGLRLAALKVHARSDACDEVDLILAAVEADLLDLFLARVRNLFCVEELRVTVGTGVHPSFTN